MEQAQKQIAPRVSLATMELPPTDPAEREEIGAQLYEGLCLRYEQIAPQQDVHLLRTAPANSTDREFLMARKRFDEYLIGQFAEWGWRMLMSRAILQTLARWEALDPDLCESVGKALARKSRVYRGQKPAPFFEGIEKFADDAIAELQTLLRLQRNEFSRRSVPAKCDRVAEWLKVEIESRPADFPLLSANVAQLHGYVSTLPARSKKAARMLERGEIRADSLFYEWFAACTNRSVKDVRNRISSRRTQK